MRRALRVARKGWGKVSPNPMVGAVLVKRGKVIADGYHRMTGEKHAEVEVLEEAGQRAKNSTLYVNLEPCSHYGKTPPCTGRVIKAGIKRVVIAMKDPNPLVSGKGITKLKKAGIETEVGLLRKEAEKLNEVYLKFITTGMPFVIVKTAMTLDGKIAAESGDSKWITGEKARKFVHHLRSGVDGILVGINTVLKDDPELRVRYGKHNSNPLKVIVDSRCRIPLNARVLDNPSNVIISAFRLCRRCEKLERLGARVLIIKGRDERVDLLKLVRKLGGMNITCLLIEGGGEIIASAISSGIVDKVLFFIAPKVIGGRCAPTPVEGKGIGKISEAIKVRRMKVRRFGEDVMIEGYLN